MALEVSAAIIGILAAAGKVAETLGPVVSAFAHAPSQAQTILTEVSHTKTILRGLQLLLDDLSTSSYRRRDLIKLDALVATLTDGVLLFSALEAIVNRLGTAEPGMSIRSRAHWAKHKHGLEELVSRIKSFKISMVLMLNILRCDSDAEAYRDRQLLLRMTSDLLHINADLADRMTRLESSQGSNESSRTRRPASLASTAIKYQPSITSRQETQGRTFDRIFMEASLGFEFDRVLKESRVYRRAQQPSCDISYRSSVVPSHAWTALSDISLSEISIISVVALPISLPEISNSYHYWTHHQREQELRDVRAWSNPVDRAIYLLRNGTSGSSRPDLISQLVTQPDRDVHSQESLPSEIEPNSPPEIPPHRPTVFTLIIKTTSEAGTLAVLEQLQRNTIYHLSECYRWEFTTTHHCIVDGTTVTLHIDFQSAFSGDSYVEVMDMQYQQGDMFMLLYSTASSASLDSLELFRHKICQYKESEDFPTMIIGNNLAGDDKRVVSTSQAMKLAVDLRCSYREVDKSNPLSVKEALHELVRQRWKFEKKNVNEDDERKVQPLARSRFGKKLDNLARRGSAPETVRKKLAPLTPIQE
ncbi:hypothetical protein FB567DRAFT_538318 [Paraphoma chrysanthemicola]|uniref:Fungal N-terminal domain-containing protein n=1 Tax=Paraphoma chrysanthemicola TaxID=798071 RepID=A0A8K0QVT1_9PLEO|nr:hypothetical protein FB567DRAFT_538318 [Paraphoma chrysanthemicola]